MRKIWLIVLLVLMLSGCKTIADIEPDTIVDIPLHPTEFQTQPAAPTPSNPTEAPTETSPVTEMTEPTEPETKPSRDHSSSGGSSSGSKKPGQGSTSTKPPATEPATMPPTQPPTQEQTQVPTDLPTQPPTEPPAQAPTDPPSYDPSGYTPGSRDRAVADAVNAQRQAEGLAALTLDTRLCAIASVRAWEASRIWGQSRPDGSAGITVLDEYGYAYSTAAENLYSGTAGGGSIVEKWMRSDARKANILLDGAAAIGVGSYLGDDGLTYVAAIFAG